MATILTKKKDTSGAPSAGDLTNSSGGAELAVNTADKRLYTKDSGGNVVEVGINPTSITTGTLNTSGAVVFNDAGADVDFRVEGDTDANLLFVDASADSIGIGTDAPNLTSFQKAVTLGDGSGTTTRYAYEINGGQSNADSSIGDFNVYNKGSLVSRMLTVRGSADNSGVLTFYTSNAGTSAERMRITSGGDFLVNRTSTNGKVCADRSGTDVGNGFHYDLTGASISAGQVGFRFLANGTGGNSVDTKAFVVRTENADRCYIYGTGDIVNANDSYGPLASDQRLKQDIVDAGSQWDDLKNLRIRKFHYRNDPDGHLQIGCIAQEAEQVSPGLVYRRPVNEVDVLTNPELGTLVDDLEKPIKDEEGNITGYEKKVETDTEVLSFKSSVLFWKATKALQEAMERIETLEAKVAALENA